MMARMTILIAVVLCLPGCQQEMARQPNSRPLEASTYFPDGRSARPLVAGTVSRDATLSSAKEFPFSITLEVLRRGQERFNIYCAVCHDRVGNGHGMIVERGFTQPPSFHTDLSRGYKLKGKDLKLTDAPVDYYFEVITHGFGAMPDYAGQIPSDDRWAIIAYIRALQLSQDATLDDIRDDKEKQRLLQSR